MSIVCCDPQSIAPGMTHGGCGLTFEVPDNLSVVECPECKLFWAVTTQLTRPAIDVKERNRRAVIAAAFLDADIVRLTLWAEWIMGLTNDMPDTLQ